MSRKQKITFTNFFKYLFKPNFFAGDEAELEFAYLAEENGYIVEKIPQDKKSFIKYIRAMGLPEGEYRSLKRGDYLVRNLANLEVEVKCLTSKLNLDGERYYSLKYKELKGLETMSELTGVSVCVAIFERDGRGVKANSLKMISLKDVLSKRTGGFYNAKYKTMTIPVRSMFSGFNLFDDFKSWFAKS